MTNEQPDKSGTPDSQNDPLAIELHGEFEKITIGGHILYHWMTGLGFAGYSPAQVQNLRHAHLGLGRVKTSTIRSRVGDGYSQGRGKQTAHNYPVAELTAFQLAAVQ